MRLEDRRDPRPAARLRLHRPRRGRSGPGRGGAAVVLAAIGLLLLLGTSGLASFAGAGERPEKGASGLPRSDRPDAAELYFITPQDGETIRGPVVVRFGLRNMGVAPAGVEKDATGHHHLLIDTELDRPDLPIPNDDRHRHFGGGQTEVVLDLPPGPHTLQLVLGDHLHVPHDPPLTSARISIVVAEEGPGDGGSGEGN